MTFKAQCVTAVFFLLALTCCSCSSRYGFIDPLNPMKPDNLLGTYASSTNEDGLFVIKVTGKGIAPLDAVNRGQAVLLAERAAVADGYRKLVERIKGLYVETNSTVGNDTVNRERIKLETESWIRGAEIMDIRQADFGITEADMRIRIFLNPNHALYRFANQTYSSNYMQ